MGGCCCGKCAISPQGATPPARLRDSVLPAPTLDSATKIILLVPVLIDRFVLGSWMSCPSQILCCTVRSSGECEAASN